MVTGEPQLCMTSLYRSAGRFEYPLNVQSVTLSYFLMVLKSYSHLPTQILTCKHYICYMHKSLKYEHTMKILYCILNFKKKGVFIHFFLLCHYLILYHEQFFGKLIFVTNVMLFNSKLVA